MPEGPDREERYMYDFAEACAEHMSSDHYDDYMLENNVDRIVTVQPWYHLGIRDACAKWLEDVAGQGVTGKEFPQGTSHILDILEFPVAGGHDIDAAKTLIHNAEAYDYIYSWVDYRSMIPVAMACRTQHYDDYKFYSKLNDWFKEKLYEVAADYFWAERDGMDLDDYSETYDRYTDMSDGVMVKFYRCAPLAGSIPAPVEQS